MGSARARARLVALCGLLFACAHHAVKPDAAQPGVFHHVRAGETLWRIAQTYGVPLPALLQENALPDPSRLAAGTLLFIPGAARELPVPPAEQPAPPQAAGRGRAARLQRAGVRPLDAAAHGTPLSWPVRGVLISGFGARARDRHDGIDLAAPEGTPICAAEEGVVLFAGQQRGYGNLVLVAHAHDLITVYAHNEENLVRQGERVARGQELGRVGRTGNATGPHLHFEVRLAARPRDPLGFLR